MSTRVQKFALSLLIAGSGALLVAPPAQANRGGGGPTTTTTQPGYVPPPQYGQNPFPQLPDEPAVYAPIEPTAVVPVDLPAVSDPGAGLAGGGEPLGPAPSEETTVLDRTETRPETQPANGGGFMGGILSRTGSESLPLARAGLATLALGLGLIIVARRRRVDPTSA